MWCGGGGGAGGGVGEKSVVTGCCVVFKCVSEDGSVDTGLGFRVRLGIIMWVRLGFIITWVG